MDQKNTELQQIIERKISDKLLGAYDSFGDLLIRIKKEDLSAVVEVLKQDSELQMDMLLDITAVDYLDFEMSTRIAEDRFDLVYHFLSIENLYRLRIKTAVPETAPQIDTLTPIYKSANFLEREVWDMYGIDFKNHPDLRRILMYPEFEGYPLRKDYPVQGKQPRIQMRHPEVENTARFMSRPELVQIGKGVVLVDKPSKDLLDADYGLGGITTSMRPRKLNDDLHTESMILNMGPTHPATHGTIRIVVEITGEEILDADVEVGYLHRGFEKMCETVTYNQVMPYTDRLNYVSPIINNVGWCLTIEKLLGIEVPKRCQYIRVIMSEISRVSDHLTCLGASAMELGAMTAMLYFMQAREYLWDLIEEVTGARLTISYSRVGGLSEDLTEGFKDKASDAFKKVRKLISDCDRLLSRNRIFLDRMCDIAVISKEDAISFGLTGPMLRASGVNYDIRRAFPYSSYNDFDFEVPLGTKGDNYDRFLVRMNEMEQSLRICEQALEKLPEGDINVNDSRVVLPPKEEVYNSIDGMIMHFELVFKGLEPPEGETYFSVEGGNGELGYYVVSDGSGKPYKAHVRSPSFIHMGSMREQLIGCNVADLIPIFGMINMIGGSVTDSAFSLSGESIKRVEQLKNHYPDKKSAVMPLLQIVQEELGHISEESIIWISEDLGMSPVHVRELVTFYTMLTDKPRGKYHFQVCRTLSCAVLGSKTLCEIIQNRCSVNPGEVSQDGMWSFEQVECLGSCGTGPMCQINDIYFENLNQEKLLEIINRIEEEKPDLSFSTTKDSLGEGLKGLAKTEVYKK